MPYKLLLADDSVTIQRVIELTFADEDVKVTAVGDGQQAIERILSDRPDIVLADVGMPKQDGYEVAAFIKGDPALEHIPVLLLTGAFEPVDEERAQAVRCDGVLAKPFEPQLLIGRVKELLKDVAPAAPAMPPAEPEPVVLAPEPSLAIEAVPATVAIEVAAASAAVAAPGAILVEEPRLEVETLGLRPDVPAPADSTLDDYFDRLDAAFAHLTGGQTGRESPVSRPAAADPWTGAVTWPAAASPASFQVEPAVELDPDRRAPDVFGPGPENGASSSPAEDLEAMASLAAVPVPDAFAALLDAERQHGPEAVHRGRPEGAATVMLPGTGVTPDFVDEVARRVLERLTDTAFRDVVAETVSAVAERLVREEIARIKASMQ